MKHWQNWAEWGWLKSLHDCNDCMSDAIGLNSCGLETDFVTEEIVELEEDSAVVKYQNSLAKRLHKLCHLIVSARAGSLVERCHYYPFRLVSLTSENPSVVKAALIEFERDVKAWWAAKDYTGIQKIANIVARCRLGHAFEQICIAFAASSQFKEVRPQLKALLVDTFSGWTQTRVNEKASKVWRDLEQRQTSNGEMATVRLWEKLTSDNVVGEFERAEVQVESGAASTSDQACEMNQLFQDAKQQVRCSPMADETEQKNVEKENTWLKEFNAILEDSGKSFNPETEQLLTAELRLLRTLSESKLWHRANDAWLTSLLPVGGLIRIKPLAKCMWVLKTNESAALLWEAEQTALSMWRKAKFIKELTWYTCFSLDDVEVLSIRILSPQSLFLQDCRFNVTLCLLCPGLRELSQGAITSFGGCSGLCMFIERKSCKSFFVSGIMCCLLPTTLSSACLVRLWTHRTTTSSPGRVFSSLGCALCAWRAEQITVRSITNWIVFKNSPCG